MLTPRLLQIHLDGAQRRLDRQARELAWAVWHVAALSRTKKLPRLNQFVPTERAKPEARGWRTDLAAWQAYAERKKR